MLGIVHKKLIREWVTELLCGLGARGVLTLLGVRKTVGSKDKMIPSAETLIRGFNKPFSRRSQIQMITKVQNMDEESKKRTPVCQLSVGARALMKHAHRSSEVIIISMHQEFWGRPIGTELQRNEIAQKIIKKMLDECIWINVHWLPHDEHVVEVILLLKHQCRIRKGYGARWKIDGKFRGFLEPQMEAGHERKWCH